MIVKIKAGRFPKVFEKAALKPKELIAQFNREGFLILAPENGQSLRSHLLSLKRLFGRVVNHRLADKDGIVVIEPNPERTQYVHAFTNRAMEIHTDGAFNTTSPSIVAMQCEIPAETGGENCLVDGKALYQYLLTNFPDQISAFFEPDAMKITRIDEVATRPIFARCGDGIRVAFRQDLAVNVVFNPSVQPLIEPLEYFLQQSRNQILCPLQKGQILIINNCRILHGRQSFGKGQCRRINRLWFNGYSPYQLKLGFDISS